MTIVLLGASCTGKSKLENALSKKYGFNKIISFTTRLMRDGEVNGQDYYFIDNEQFKEMLNCGQFAEYEEYSQSRFYGTLKTDYQNDETDENKVVVLTPGGLRQIRKNCPDEDIFAVLITAPLGTRMIRYIRRCGDNFSFDDKNEIAARVERDFGAFAGVESEVDLVIENDEETEINALAELIIKRAQGVEHVIYE